MQPHLSDELYRRFRDLLARRAGLHFPETKRDDLAHRLTQARQAASLPSLDALYTAAHDDGKAWEAIVTHLTIGETYFFRHAAQFEVLRQHIFPQLIAERSALRMLRIWSAGCATGEEPYSLAMLLHELLPEPATWHVTILATDINPLFLERARNGLYGAWSFREGEAAVLRERYFTPEQERWRLRPEIRRMVSFAPLNLAGSGYPTMATGTCALDLIVCRNVTIYFDEVVTRQIAERFYQALLPGGWLLVGHAEPHAVNYRQFQVRNFPDAIFYRKAPDAPGFAIAPTGGGAGERAPRPARPPIPRGEVPSVAPPYPVGPRSALNSSGTRPDAVDEGTLWSDVQRAIQENDDLVIERLTSALLRTVMNQEVALLRLARIAADQGAWVRAEYYCGRAIAHNTLSVPTHLLLAQICAHQGRLDAALEAYRRVLYLDPTVVVAMLGMASVWSELGRPVEAARSWRAAIRHLDGLPPHVSIPDADGATTSELRVIAQKQLQMIAVSATQDSASRSHEGRTVV